MTVDPGMGGVDGIVFPGQGVDPVDLVRVLDEHRDAPEVDALRDVLGGPRWAPEDLARQDVAQPAVVAAAVVSARTSLRSRPITALAGHSLGEIAAAVHARSLDLAAALRLARRRAELCDRAHAERPGAMVAILGADEVEVDWIRRTTVAPGEVLDFAVHNGAKQFVLSGDRDAVTRAGTCAQDAGLVVRTLPVAGAYHSSLLASLVDDYRALLAVEITNDPDVPIVSSTTAATCRTAADLVEALARALVLPVRWSATLEALTALGVHALADPGPGRSLATLASRNPVLPVVALRPR